MTDSTTLIKPRYPRKMHLANLPDLPVPMPRYERGNRFCIVHLIPFNEHHSCKDDPGDTYLELFVVRAACWSLRSFLLHTDAIEYGVDYKFYVEEPVYGRTLAILERNGFCEEDMVRCDLTEYEVPPAWNYGKKLAIFNDARFAEYDWVIPLDVDMFFAAMDLGEALDFNNTYPMFANAKDWPDRIGAVVRHRLEQASEADTLATYDFHSKEIESSMEEWIRRLERVTGQPRSVIICEGQPVHLINGGMYLFPAKQFFTQRRGDCEWISNAGKLLQNDEITFDMYDRFIEELWSYELFSELPFFFMFDAIHLARQQLTMSDTTFGLLHANWCDEEYVFRLMIGGYHNGNGTL